MRPRPGGWLDLLRSLGDAFRELVRSELEALGEELTGTGRRLAVAALLLLAALFFLFWTLGLFAFFAVELAALWLPRWGAALAVAGLGLAVGLILALVGRARLRRLEKPTDTVRRRVSEHADWWRERVLDVVPEELRDEPPSPGLPEEPEAP